MGRDTLADEQRKPKPPPLKCLCCGKPGIVHWYNKRRVWHRRRKCRDCKREYNQALYHRRPARDTYLRKQYGITYQEYVALKGKQGGTCAICKRKCVTGKRLAVDHDHTTGTVRGLLCLPCNTALGGFQDDPDLLLSAIRYLQTSGEST